MINKVSVTMPTQSARSYTIMLGASLYDLKTWLPHNASFSTIVIITDNTVRKHYGLDLQKIFQQAGHESLLFSFPSGEKFKNSKTKQTIEDKMLLHYCNRETLIVALGGGVVGDIAGYIAATFMRGIPYIQIPTTLLAMVDSSIGGKTGINTFHGKNLLGVIYPPIYVVSDLALLKTLSKKNRINGLVEAIKMFLTHDVDSFEYIKLHLHSIIKGDLNCLNHIVKSAVKIKAAVVARDAEEIGDRFLLNFGHTIGHALEKISGYSILHGYAVGYGILIEATISNIIGLLPDDQLLIIKELFRELGIQGKDLQQYEISKIILATKNDKKVQLGKVHYILLQEIGNAFIINDQYIHAVEDIVVIQALKLNIEG